MEPKSEPDDLLVFEPEEAMPLEAAPPGEPWRVLLVDDEPQVHTVTVLALAGLELDGRALVIAHAHSAAQARDALKERDDWALVLLDVVMETDDAGLQLVRWLREVHGNRHTRVVLRTGQPGAAPEREVMRSYDINDYQPKVELSASRLVTAVIGGLRAYRDLRTIADQAERIRKLHDEQTDLLTAFARFVPVRMLQAIGARSPSEAALGDHIEADMTLLFLDVRAFTRLSEAIGPERTFALLNRLFAAVVPHLHAEGGIVDKFLGDGLLAIFPEHPASAVRAAYAILEGIDALVEQDALPPEIDVGIGIHCGRTVLGVVGSEERLETTVVADAVNVAARLEHLTRDVGCRLIVSDTVYRALPAELATPARALGEQPVRGRRAPIPCWDLPRVERPQKPRPTPTP
jgi:two-component system sensor histidine kinase ChiS